MKPVSQNVVSIVVTYQPNLDVVESLLSSLLDQVKSVVIVDNGSKTDGLTELADKFPGRTELIQFHRNYGIAKAQNQGIEFAKGKGAEFVLLLDQDSIPAPDMVIKLVDAANALPHAASLGPRYLDNRQGNPPPFISINGLRLHRYMCENDNKIVPVDYLISSGSLIPLKVIKAVGPMREELFIDYVDIEWGLRAKSYGYQSYGVCGAKMSHTLGDNPISFFGRKIPYHSPSRHYYHFRNAIWLYKQPWVPWNWKIVDSWRLLRKYIFYSLFAKPGAQHLKMMSLGLLHGFVGRMGPLTDLHSK